MEFIKVGKTVFSAKSLKGKKLSDVYEQFSYIKKDIVKMAHSEANPKRKSNSKKN